MRHSKASGQASSGSGSSTAAAARRRAMTSEGACAATRGVDACNVRVLRAVAQRMIHQRYAPSSLRRSASRGCRRRDRDGRASRSIVALPALVDRCARQPDAGRRLDRNVHDDVLARSKCRRECRPRCCVRNPCGVISSECSVPFCSTARETGADLDALDGVDAHHGVRDVGIELVVDGLAPARPARPMRRS